MEFKIFQTFAVVPLELVFPFFDKQWDPNNKKKMQKHELNILQCTSAKPFTCLGNCTASTWLCAIFIWKKKILLILINVYVFLFFTLTFGCISTFFSIFSVSMNLQKKKKNKKKTHLIFWFFHYFPVFGLFPNQTRQNFPIEYLDSHLSYIEIFHLESTT